MSMLKETLQKFIENKPEFLNILGFEDCSFDEHNEIYTCIFNCNITFRDVEYMHFYMQYCNP